MSNLDSDLDKLDRDALLAELCKIRAAIREHRDCSGHDLCWHHPKLWNFLPEKSALKPEVPEWPEFLRGCIKYRQSLDTQLPDALRIKKEFKE
jgi:hypothetical protein